MQLVVKRATRVKVLNIWVRRYLAIFIIICNKALGMVVNIKVMQPLNMGPS